MGDPAKNDTPFLLDPKYANFQPGHTPLRFETLTDPDGWGCAVGTVLFYGPLMLMMVALMTCGLIQEVQFRLSGQETTATISQCEMVDAGKSGMAAKISFHYNVDGQFYGDDDTLPQSVGNCNLFAAGKTLAVRYLSDEPNTVRIVDPQASRSPLENLVVNAGLLFTMLFTVYASYWSLSVLYRRVWAGRAYPLLQKNGVLLDGEIVRISGRTDSKNNQHYIRVKYTFLSPRKRQLTGQMYAIRNDLKYTLLPLPGTPVKVLYADNHAHIML